MSALSDQSTLRRYRVTGIVRYHLAPRADDEVVTKALLDVRRWKREHDNDAELGTAYNAPVRDMESRGESADFALHLNGVKAASLAAALTVGLTTLHARLVDLGRAPDDAYELEVGAVLEHPKRGVV